MATASEVAQRGLKRILVEADEATLVGTEYADFYTAMNDYMAELEAMGIKLGYTDVTTGTDTITVPPGAIRGIIANVAIEVSPDYGGNVTPELQRQAASGLKALRRLGIQKIQVKYPRNLPSGSGRETDTYRNYAFYRMQDLAVISINATVIVTPAVTATQYKIAGPWNVEAAQGFRADISGEIQYAGVDDIDVDVKLTLNLTSSSTFIFYVTNGSGTEVLTSAATAIGTGTDVTLAGMLTMRAGDYLEVRYQDTLAATALTINEAHLRLN